MDIIGQPHSPIVILAATKLLLLLATATQNINQNGLLDYYATLAPNIIHTLARALQYKRAPASTHSILDSDDLLENKLVNGVSKQSTNPGPVVGDAMRCSGDVLALLILLCQYRRYETMNPFIVSINAIDPTSSDWVALEKGLELLCEQCVNAQENRWQESIDTSSTQANDSVLSRVTWVFSRLTSFYVEEKPSKPRQNVQFHTVLNQPHLINTVPLLAFFRIFCGRASAMAALVRFSQWPTTHNGSPAPSECPQLLRLISFNSHYIIYLFFFTIYFGFHIFYYTLHYYNIDLASPNVIKAHYHSCFSCPSKLSPKS